MKNKNGAKLIFRILSVVFYVIAAVFFFMRSDGSGFITYAVISLAVGAVFSSVAAAIALKDKEKDDENGNDEKK